MALSVARAFHDLNRIVQHLQPGAGAVCTF